MPKTSTIKMEDLIADGWNATLDTAFPFEKKLPNRNPLNDDEEETGIKLVIHLMYNTTQLALALPDGGLININVASMRALKQFENAIDFYDCPY